MKLNSTLVLIHAGAAPRCDKREGGDLFCLKDNLHLNIFNYFQFILVALARCF